MRTPILQQVLGGTHYSHVIVPNAFRVIVVGGLTDGVEGGAVLEGEVVFIKRLSRVELGSVVESHNVLVARLRVQRLDD